MRRPRSAGQSSLRCFLRFELLHDAADVLGAVARADQQSVGGVDDDQIANAHRRDELVRAPEEVARGVERKEAARRNVFAWLCGEQFVDGGPGADVAPADGGGKDEDRAAAAVARGGFEDGIVDGDVFELRIDAAQSGVIARRANGVGQAQERGVSLRQKALEERRETWRRARRTCPAFQR